MTKTLRHPQCKKEMPMITSFLDTLPERKPGVWQADDIQVALTHEHQTIVSSEDSKLVRAAQNL